MCVLVCVCVCVCMCVCVCVCNIVHLADDDDDDSDDESQSVRQKGCSVVWEGKVLDRAFNDWKVCRCEYFMA